MKSYYVTLALVSSLALLGSSMGCAVSSPAPEASDAPEASAASELKGETTLINEENHATLKGVEMRIERRAGEPAFSLVEGSDWKTVAPGVWELPSADGNSQRVAVGEDGNRWLVKQADVELDALYAQRDADEVKPELEQKIAATEKMRAAAEQSAKSAVAGPTPQAVSCNISLYTGAGSPWIGTSGAAAIAQIICSGGCTTFTVTSQACCGGYCSGLSAVARTVCGTQWTAGTAVSGYGLGYASVNVNPPNITQTSSSFYCQ